MSENPARQRAPQPHALVVDDELDVVEFIRIILECSGFRVTSATTGKQALELFPAHQWDVVITDRVMPGMSGDELRAAIRQLNPNLPIVLVSGHLGEPSECALFDAVVLKPFTPEAFSEVISRVVA